MSKYPEKKWKFHTFRSQGYVYPYCVQLMCIERESQETKPNRVARNSLVTQNRWVENS